MERAKITNVLGDVIMVPQWQLQKSAMEKFASEHYGEVVICDPGLVYDCLLYTSDAAAEAACSN